MHFLSHYYVDRHLDRAYFALGAMIPDISPHFTRTYNSVIRRREWDFEGDLTEIHRGVLRHYDVDKQFHSSLQFQKSCQNALSHMMIEGLDRDRYRLSFLAHIAVEVMLDRQLIVQNNGLTIVYYDLLESIRMDNFRKYLKVLMTEQQMEATVRTFERFLEVKFLNYLEQTEGAAEGIMRTANRAIGVDFTEADREKLINALHNIDLEMRYSWNKLLEIN